MKTTLAILLFATFPLFAEPAGRDPFPSDYTPSPCAPDSGAVCETFAKQNYLTFGAQFRGFALDRKWIDEHWDEMRTAFLPICGKIANCFTIPGNPSTFCIDLARDEFQVPCERFERGTRDHDQCSMFATTQVIGLGIKKQLHQEAQSCATKAATGETRRLEAWTSPSRITSDFDGRLRIFAIDAESRIPVRARIASDGPGRFRSTEGPVPTAAAILEWNPRLKRVPNEEGHTNVVRPSFTLQADGYEPLTIPAPIEIRAMVVEMDPSPAQLRPGKNVVTITTRDSVTGQLVEARVMAGAMIAGETNMPIELVIERGKGIPEIWVTSLFDRYSDVVVSPARK